MVKENKKTFTYSGKPSLREKATKKAAKEGLTFSEKVEQLLEGYVSTKNGVLLAVWAIDWTESERGWGQRPDGTSLYKSEELAKKHIKEDTDRKSKDKEVPECYSFPGKPYLKQVDKKVYDIVMAKGSSWL